MGCAAHAGARVPTLAVLADALHRWAARLFFRDLYEVIQFYRTSTERTDIEALRAEFPGWLTPFGQFLEETRWGDAEATYEDLAGALTADDDGLAPNGPPEAAPEAA